MSCRREFSAAKWGRGAAAEGGRRGGEEGGDNLTSREGHYRRRLPGAGQTAEAGTVVLAVSTGG